MRLNELYFSLRTKHISLFLQATVNQFILLLKQYPSFHAHSGRRHKIDIVLDVSELPYRTTTTTTKMPNGCEMDLWYFCRIFFSAKFMGKLSFRPRRQKCRLLLYNVGDGGRIIYTGLLSNANNFQGGWRGRKREKQGKLQWVSNEKLSKNSLLEKAKTSTFKHMTQGQFPHRKPSLPSSFSQPL